MRGDAVFGARCSGARLAGLPRCYRPGGQLLHPSRPLVTDV